MDQSATALASRGMDLGQPVIDVDIHCNIPSFRALFPYLSTHWREYVTYSAFKGATDTAYPPNAPTSALPDGFGVQVMAENARALYKLPTRAKSGAHGAAGAV